MTKLKICGIRTLEEVAMLNDIKPSFAGFVFATSKRQVTLEEAKILRQHLDKEIQTVGVFVDAEIEFIATLVKEKIIDCIQLHGNEDDCYLSILKAKLTIPIIKAIRVSSIEDTAKKSDADMVLYDTYHKELKGGTGETFNWDLLKKKTGNYFLAGGLTSENIQEAIQQLRPYAVDISSGVETDGFKDKTKLIELVKKIQEVNL